MALPALTPANLVQLPAAFDDSRFLFELKMDGFRALAYVDGTSTRLVSRNGNRHTRFGDLVAAIRGLDCKAVLDGEIVCLDEHGRPQFFDLLRPRRDPIFYAFDVLWLDGEDVRSRPLVERKKLLKWIMPEQPAPMLYARHIERRGLDFFRLACEQDLEGIVAKLKHGAYGEGWFKIRNPKYSQYEGRRELFERRLRGAVVSSKPALGARSLPQAPF